MRELHKIAVIGSGAWGTTIASILAQNKRDVTLFCPRSETSALLNELRENPRVPGLKLAQTIFVTDQLSLALSGVDAIVLAVPSKALSIVDEIRPFYFGQPVLSLVKGFSPMAPEFLCVSDFVLNRLGEPVAVLSGPNLALEIAKGFPAASVVASFSEPVAKQFQHVLSTDSFRVYTTQDVRGVELGGILKNCIAIASGICVGLELGDNARSALVTRGLLEMVKVGEALGSQVTTFYGLSGLGDLVATCFSPSSRNFHFGYELARAQSLDALLENSTIEGYKSVQVVHTLAVRLGLELPILSAVYRMLYESGNPKDLLLELMRRRLKSETI